MSNIVVYGKDKTGNGLKEMLSKLGKNAVLYDDSDGFDGRGRFCSKSLVILSPGVPPQAKGVKIACRRGAFVVGELEFCFPLCAGKCISVTGTNGKTTVCEMIYKILRECNFTAYLLGNGGVPFCTEVLQVRGDETVVLESSSFQLDRCSAFAPYISVCTNVATDHLNYHKTVADYMRAKKNNFIHQRNGFAIFNSDDETCVSISAECRCTKLFYSLYDATANCYFDGANVILRDGAQSCAIAAPFLQQFVKPNRSNALAAITACCAMGVLPDAAVNALKTYTPLPHRLQYVCTVDGVNFVDDSKATNVHATICALRCFDDNLALILGGSDKGESFDGIFERLPPNVLTVAAAGDTAQRISLDARHYGVAVEIFADIAQAAQYCYQSLAKRGGGTVLMSNACASFDRFGSYAERGEYFQKAVLQIYSENKKN